jgi:hypothetical protein
MSDLIGLDQRVKISEHVAARELDGELVVLNFETETYFGLDEVGTRIWEALRSAPTIAEATKQLLDEYDVAEEVLRADVQALVGQLVDSGLIELEPA